MRLPLQITFRHVDPSPSVEDRIREYAGELDRFFDQIMSCGTVAHSLALRHRPEFELHVQGPGCRCEASSPADFSTGSDCAWRDAYETASNRSRPEPKVRIQLSPPGSQLRS